MDLTITEDFLSGQNDSEIIKSISYLLKKKTNVIICDSNINSANILKNILNLIPNINIVNIAHDISELSTILELNRIN